MDHYKLFKLLVTPSLLGGIVTVLVALVSLTSAGVLYVTENQLFYDYLFGGRGVSTVLLQAPDTWNAVWNSIANGPFAYYVLVMGAAALGGLLAWALLRSLSKVAARSGGQSGQPADTASAVEEFERLGVRVGSFLLAAVYLIFFVNVITPFAIILLQQGIDSLDASETAGGLLHIALATVFYTACLHVHIILLRLITLRPRIFGGWDEEGERL